VEIREMFLEDFGGSETFEASWTLKWAVPAVTPGVALNIAGVMVRASPEDAHTASEPAAEDLTLNTVRGL